MEVAILKKSKMSDVAQEVKSYFNKDTLIPISLMLVLVAPIMFITNLSAKVDRLESELKQLNSDTVKKEVFHLQMENFKTKLDQVIYMLDSKTLNSKK